LLGIKTILSLNKEVLRPKGRDDYVSWAAGSVFLGVFVLTLIYLIGIFANNYY